MNREAGATGPAAGRPAAPAAAVVLAAALLAAAAACAQPYEAGRLLDELQSQDLEVRQDAGDRLARLLKSGEYEVFLRGARTLKGPARVQSILYLSKFEGKDARAAMRSLLRVEHRELIPWNPIRMKPQSEPTDSRILVAHLIAQAGGDPQAAPVLLQGAEGQPPEVLIGTLYALGALRDPQAVPLLAGAAGHADPEIARAAVEALARIRTPEAFQALRAAAGHPAEQVRIDLLSALEVREEPETAAVLRGIARGDASAEIRAAAVRLLSRFREPDVIEFLIERLGADAPSRQAAHEALLHITGQGLGPDPRLWSRWWAQNAAAFRPGA